MYLSIDEVNAFLNTFEPIYEKLKKEKYKHDAIENIVSKNTKLKNKINLITLPIQRIPLDFCVIF